jgi:hypothetical protein
MNTIEGIDGSDSGIAANKQDFCSLIEEVRVHICAHGTLPDKLTEKQVRPGVTIIFMDATS